jgi:hypothetical protein
MRLAVIDLPSSVAALQTGTWIVGGKNCFVALPCPRPPYGAPLAQANAVTGSAAFSHEVADAAPCAGDHKGKGGAPQQVSTGRSQHLAYIRLTIDANLEPPSGDHQLIYPT